jgi:hypothetical protein
MPLFRYAMIQPALEKKTLFDREVCLCELCVGRGDRVVCKMVKTKNDPQFEIGANQLSTVGIRKDHINRQNKKEKCWSGSTNLIIMRARPKDG